MIADKFAPDIVAGKGTSQEREAQRAMLLGASKLIGVAAAGATGGDVGVGAEVANNATEYNFLGPASEAKREADRAAVRNLTASAAQAAELKALDQGDQRSNYLKQKVDAGESLSPEESAEWLADTDNYLLEMQETLGVTKGTAAYNSMLQHGAVTTYTYPFAGTDEQKAAWDRENGLGVIGSVFRTESEDEKLDDTAKLIIAADSVRRGLDKVGELSAMLIVPGGAEVAVSC
jgi:filamentous hemagglutinin